MKEILKSWMDVEMIMENYPITTKYSYGIYLRVAITVYQVQIKEKLRYILTSSNYPGTN